MVMMRTPETDMPGAPSQRPQLFKRAPAPPSPTMGQNGRPGGFNRFAMLRSLVQRMSGPPTAEEMGKGGGVAMPRGNQGPMRMPPGRAPMPHGNQGPLKPPTEPLPSAAPPGGVMQEVNQPGLGRDLGAGGFSAESDAASRAAMPGADPLMSAPDASPVLATIPGGGRGGSGPFDPRRRVEDLPMF